MPYQETFGTVWRHCIKHNIDFPERDGCPYCNGTLDFKAHLEKKRQKAVGKHSKSYRLTHPLEWLESEHNKDVAKCNAHRAEMNLPPRTNEDELDCRKIKCKKGCPIEA